MARKLAVLVETEPILLEKLSENGQLELLYDMEQPLAFVLAKMEIAGITVKKETLLEMQAENELVIEKLTQEIYELAVRSLISTRLSSWAYFSLKNWDFL